MFDPRLSVPTKEIVTVTLFAGCVTLCSSSVVFHVLGIQQRRRKGKAERGRENEDRA